MKKIKIKDSTIKKMTVFLNHVRQNMIDGCPKSISKLQQEDHVSNSTQTILKKLNLYRLTGPKGTKDYEVYYESVDEKLAVRVIRRINKYTRDSFNNKKQTVVEQEQIPITTEVKKAPDSAKGVTQPKLEFTGESIKIPSVLHMVMEVVSSMLSPEQTINSQAIKKALEQINNDAKAFNALPPNTEAIDMKDLDGADAININWRKGTIERIQFRKVR